MEERSHTIGHLLVSMDQQFQHMAEQLIDMQDNLAYQEQLLCELPTGSAEWLDMDRVHREMIDDQMVFAVNAAMYAFAEKAMRIFAGGTQEQADAMHIAQLREFDPYVKGESHFFDVAERVTAAIVAQYDVRKGCATHVVFRCTRSLVARLLETLQLPTENN